MRREKEAAALRAKLEKEAAEFRAKLERDDKDFRSKLEKQNAPAPKHVGLFTLLPEVLRTCRLLYFVAVAVTRVEVGR